tara:strand:- start:1464 stop:2135 length:672 start_codon:yes stop_codon:yes gene_type:complete
VDELHDPGERLEGDARLARRIDDDRWWHEHYGVPHDPTGLESEANLLRYVPHPDVVVRLGEGATAAEEARVAAAARRCGVSSRVSRLVEESDADFAASLADHGFGRVRAVGPVGDEVRRAAVAADVIDEAVTASGRLELRWYLREQSVSRTLHRFGNLVGAEGGMTVPVEGLLVGIDGVPSVSWTAIDLVRRGKFLPAALPAATGTADVVVDSFADVPGLLDA